MTERYYLNTDTCPTIPTPHDCAIKEITFDSEYLVLEFEDGISRYDSVKYINPNASSLIIRIHLTDPQFDTYQYKLKAGFFREGYVLIDNGRLRKLAKNKPEYLYHTVGFSTVMIKLFQGGCYLLEINADFIEFEWIEKQQFVCG